jgi:hypothetical protein
MDINSEPEPSFSPWNAWRHRERTADDLDVPREYGVPGLYLLATSEICSVNHTHSSPRHLSQNVIYIGMSKQVTQRLERHHKAVGRYRIEMADNKCERLMYSQWMPYWRSNVISVANKVRDLAYVRFLERKLIWEYVQAFGTLPRLNGN